MKRVLIYCDDFFPNNTGYANAFLGLIESLLTNTSDIYIEVITTFPLGDNIEIERKNLRITRLKNIKIPKIGFLIKSICNSIFINRYFFKKEFDLLFVETFDNVFFLSFLSKRICKKTLVRVHSTSDTEYTFFSHSFLFNIRRFIIKKFIIKKIKFFASTNNFHIDFMKKHYFKDNVIEIGEKAFFLIPNTTSIDAEDIVIKNTNSDKIKLMMLGRMDDLGFNQKGFFDFLLSLKLLSTDQISKFDITIVGKGKNISNVHQFTKEYNNIKVIENLSHKDCLALMKSIDAIVLPSRYEGLSMFALESIALGKICLFSKVGGLIDLVDGNGMLFDPQSFEQLSNNLKTLIGLKDEEILLMKARSREIYLNKFSSMPVCERFLFAYHAISLIK